MFLVTTNQVPANVILIANQEEKEVPSEPETRVHLKAAENKIGNLSGTPD